MSLTPLPTGNNKRKTTADNDAFPRKLGHGFSEGLSKREYFAAVAMQGLLASSEYFTSDCVVRSVKLADQLIIELNKTN
jgi:hypothetical protein